MKYNQEMYDKQGKRINPGNIVVINDHYGREPHIGVADHFTDSGRVAVIYDWWSKWAKRNVKCWAYRYPSTVIKISNGKKRKNEVQSNKLSS